MAMPETYNWLRAVTVIIIMTCRDSYPFLFVEEKQEQEQEIKKTHWKLVHLNVCQRSSLF